MNTKIIRESEKPFVVFYVIIAIVHFFLPLNWADDKVFAKYSVSLGFEKFISKSARPFTDALTYFCCGHHIVWRLLNPIVLVIFAFFLAKMLDVNTKTNIVKICILVIFPAMVVVDAGFIATSLNYLWTATAGIIAIYPLKNLIAIDKNLTYTNPKIWWYFISLPMLMYACNAQQVCVALGGLFATSILMMIIKRKFSLYAIYCFIITAIMAVVSLQLNISGSNNRLERESFRYFPEFKNLSIFNKVELGFSSTMFSLTMTLHFAYFAFLILLAYIMIVSIKKYKKSIKIVPSVLNFISIVCFEAIDLLTPKNKVINFITGGLKNYGIEKAVYKFSVVTDLIFLIIIMLLLLSLYLILDKETFFNSGYVLLLGLATRMLMGFSPTVWASGFRTFFIMFISFICIGVFISDALRLKDIQ